MSAILTAPGGRSVGAQPQPAPPSSRSARPDDLWPHTTRVLPWSLAAFMAMLWLIPFDAIDLPVPIPMGGQLDRPVLVGILFVWLAAWGIGGRRVRPRLRLIPLHGIIALFFVVAVASVLHNMDVLANLGELSLATKKLFLLASYVTFFVLVGSVIRPAEVPRFLKFALGLAVVAAVAGIYEYRFETNPFYDWGSKIIPWLVSPSDLHTIDYSGRTTVYGPMGHPLELAMALALFLPFALVRILEAPGRARRWRATLVTGVLLAGIFATQRKTGLIVSFAGVLLVLAYRPRSIRRLIPTLIGLMLIMHVLAPGAMGSLRAQLEPGHLTNTNSTEQRANDYDGVAPDVRTHPALGRGYGSYDPLRYRILDNQYLGLVVMVGAIGTAVYLLIAIVAVRTANGPARGPNRSQRAAALGLAGGIVAFAVASALFDILSFPHVTYTYFFMLGLIAALRTPVRPAQAG